MRGTGPRNLGQPSLLLLFPPSLSLPRGNFAYNPTISPPKCCKAHSTGTRHHYCSAPTLPPSPSSFGSSNFKLNPPTGHDFQKLLISASGPQKVYKIFPIYPIAPTEFMQMTCFYVKKTPLSLSLSAFYHCSVSLWQ